MTLENGPVTPICVGFYDQNGLLTRLSYTTGLPLGLRYNATRPLLTDGQTASVQSDANAALLVNTGVYLGDLTSTAKSVTTTAAVLVNANTARTYLLIQNQDATNAIFIKPDGVATANGGSIRIGPLSQIIFENGFIPRQAFSAISSAGSPVVNVTEGS